MPRAAMWLLSAPSSGPAPHNRSSRRAPRAGAAIGRVGVEGQLEVLLRHEARDDREVALGMGRPVRRRIAAGEALRPAGPRPCRSRRRCARAARPGIRGSVGRGSRRRRRRCTACRAAPFRTPARRAVASEFEFKSCMMMTRRPSSRSTATRKVGGSWKSQRKISLPGISGRRASSAANAAPPTPARTPAGKERQLAKLSPRPVGAQR